MGENSILQISTSDEKGKHANFHVKLCGMFVNATGIMGASQMDLFLVIVMEMEF